MGFGASPPILYPVGTVGLFRMCQKQSQQVAPSSSRVKNTTLTPILKGYRFLFVDLFNGALKLHSYASLQKKKINKVNETLIIVHINTICRCGHCARNLRNVGSQISLQGSHSCSGNNTWGCASHWGWLCSVLWPQSSWSWLCCCSTCGLLPWWCWPWQQL